MDKTASYKNLIVYQKAKTLTISITKYFSKFQLPRTEEYLIIQLLKAVSSISANIAEGYGRYYEKSYRQFLSISRGSCFEVESWLELLVGLKKFDEDILNEFLKENNQIGKILTTMMKNLEKKTQS